MSTERTTFFGILREFKQPQLYKPFLIMVSFFAIQQFSGIFVIFIYAAQFSLEAGVNMDEFLSAVIIGAIRCVATIITAFAADWFGKKPLVIWSGVGMFSSMFGLALCSAFSSSIVDFNWLPAVLLFIFIFTGTFGILTLPFAMVAEMYPQKSRGFASGSTMSLCFFFCFIVVKTFSFSFDYFGNVAVFSFYAFVSLIGIVFGVFVLPETKGKSLQQIEEHFRKT